MSPMYDSPELSKRTLAGVLVVAGDAVARAGELEHQRQPDVADADDDDARRLVVDLS